MANNPVFEYHLFGLYTIEIGKFFRDKFANFKLLESKESMAAQVFFGTPRAAFRYYFTKFNGLIKMPMISYHMTSCTRKFEYEPTNVFLWDKENYDPVTGTTQVMKAPGVFELTYSVNIFNNSYRERDYMMHTIFNAFPKRETHLIYFPDLVNAPETYLQMPLRIEEGFTDETEIEGLEQKETRDTVRTTLSLTCYRAFVPYDVETLLAIESIEFEQRINDILTDNEPTITIYKELRARPDAIAIGGTIHPATGIIT